MELLVLFIIGLLIAIIVLPFVFWLNDPMTRWGKRWQVSRRDRNRLWRQALRARRSA